MKPSRPWHEEHPERRGGQRLPLRLPLDLLLGLWESTRAVLPSTQGEAAVWMAGFTTAFVVHWLILLLVSWLYCSGRAGGC